MSRFTIWTLTVITDQQKQMMYRKILVTILKDSLTHQIIMKPLPVGKQQNMIGSIKYEKSDKKLQNLQQQFLNNIFVLYKKVLMKNKCCIYCHCKKRQNRKITLSVVSLSAVILVPFAVFICIFLHFWQSSFQEQQRRSCLVAKRSLVKFSSNAFVFATSSKFKVL